MSAVGKRGYKETEAGWIPNDWLCLKLGDVMDFRGGNGFKELYQGKTHGAYPFIKVSDFNLPGNEKFIKSANNWIDEKERALLKATLFEKGVVVFAKVGAALLLNRRRILTVKTAIDNNLMAATPKEIDGIYSYYYLQTLDFGALVQEGAIPSINQGQLQALLFAQPPISEQRKIAAILTSVDDKLDIISKQIEATQTLKRGLMQTLFSRGVGTQDVNGRWVPHTEFKDSELGAIPAGWEVSRLDAVAEAITVGIATSTTEHYVEDGVPLIRNQNIREDFLDMTSLLKISPDFDERNKNKRVLAGDILTVRTGYPGVSCVVPEGLGRVQTFTTLITRLNKNKLNPNFASRYFNSDQGKALMLHQAAGGAQQNINAGNLKKLLVPLPPLAEQEKISSVIEGVERKIRCLQEKHIKYSSLKSGLMQKLLTGEWRVKVEASDSVKMADVEPELA